MRARRRTHPFVADDTLRRRRRLRSILPPSRRGATESGMLHLADWLQTFCALAGVAPCTDAEAAAAGLPAIDSLDMWPLLSGANGTSPRTEIAMTSAGKEALVRADGMKLLTGSDIPFALWTGPSACPPHCQRARMSSHAVAVATRSVSQREHTYVARARRLAPFSTPSAHHHTAWFVRGAQRTAAAASTASSRAC